MFKDNYFAGQTAFVTGATGGIGQAIATKLHDLGAFVYISGSNVSKLEMLRNKLGLNRIDIINCDLRDKKQVENMLNDVSKLDILVCNAGITCDKLAIKTTTDEFTEVIDLNLTANFILNKQAIIKMMKARYGRIINISSIVALTGNIGQSSYAASKAGLIGMSKSLAAETASRNITINVVAPGFIDTPMTEQLNEKYKEKILNTIPTNRFGKSEDVASIVAYLASREASYITGQTIHVNGGLMMV